MQSTYQGPIRILLDCGHVQVFTKSEAREVRAFQARGGNFYCTGCGTAEADARMGGIAYNA